METIKDFTDKLKNILNMNGSKRRSRLGVGVAFWENQSWYHRNKLARWTSGGFLPDKFVREVADDLEGGWLKRNDVFALQRNGKKALAMRSVDDLSEELRKRLDQRRDWNQENRAVETVLDLFPSLKFAHESMLPLTARLRKRGIDPKFQPQKICSDTITLMLLRPRITKMSVLDLMIFVGRTRFGLTLLTHRKNCINGDCVGVSVMTLTIFHRWHT